MKNFKTKSIFICDGRSRSSLPIIRTFGEKKFKVVIGESFKCFSFMSKYVDEKVIYPDPEKNPEEFYNFIKKYLSENKIDLFIPVRDETTYISSVNKKELSKITNLIVPDKIKFEICRDKSKTIKFIRNLKIPHPKTIINFKYLTYDSIIKKVGLPFLFKPCIGSGSRGIIKISSEIEYSNTYRKVVSENRKYMIQEFIPNGGAFGVEVVYFEGERKAYFVHKRLREYPISGGPSTLRLSVHDSLMEELSFKIFDNLKWHGVAMAEFRVDNRDNKPKLMEINPRFWGSLSTGIFAGVDFPFILYCLINNVEFKSDYEVGKMSRWLLFGDVLWFISTKNKIKNLRKFFKFHKHNITYDIISKDDFMPTIGIFADLIKTLFNLKKLKHIFKRGW